MIGSEDERVNQDVGTPRPWKEWPGNVGVRIVGPVTGNGKRDVVAIMPIAVERDIQTANAALIVDAVNAYDRLRRVEAAARAVMALIEEDEYFQPEAVALREALDPASLRDKETAK